MSSSSNEPRHVPSVAIRDAATRQEPRRDSDRSPRGAEVFRPGGVTAPQLVHGDPQLSWTDNPHHAEYRVELERRRRPRVEPDLERSPRLDPHDDGLSGTDPNDF